jgi:hypothetical protein
MNLFDLFLVGVLIFLILLALSSLNVKNLPIVGKFIDSLISKLPEKLKENISIPLWILILLVILLILK